MVIYTVVSLVVLLIWGLLIAAGIYLFSLVVKALRKYISSQNVRQEKQRIVKSLSQQLKEQRLRCKMTQAFVAEALGVSRQAVSKWESGACDPSTSNLLALAKPYGIQPEELLRCLAEEGEENTT